MYGEVLKDLRIKKGLTQQQLAKILGFKSASAEGMVEREERELNMTKLLFLADYFNVSSDYLMGILPFKNETEAYHSISVASIKYLRDNPLAFPYNLQSYFDYVTVFENIVHDEIKAYSDGLISKYESKLYLTDLELFELSNILFLNIKWSQDYNGLVHFQAFNDKYLPFSVQLDFNKIDKITLDLSKSILVNYKAYNNTFVKYTSLIDTKSKELDSFERVSTISVEPGNHIFNNPETIDKRLKDIEILEDLGDAKHALKFILSQPILAAYGGYDLNNMADEEIIELAEDMLFTMRLSLKKLRKRKK